MSILGYPEELYLLHVKFRPHSVFFFYLQLMNISKLTNYINDQAEDLMNKINQTKNKYEMEKTDTKNLIEKIKNYLRGTAYNKSVSSFW